MDIVAPAGNMERFYAAVKAGADEIFMGLKGFGARRNAENFTLSEYMEAIDYAHRRGIKILLTLNTMMMDSEIEALYPNLKVLYEHGLDAVIVQDLGFAGFIRENFPGLELHGSTQMTVANHVEAEYLKSIGFSRVVPSRELTFEEIKAMREKTDIELEIFVSGALCICYSGNCYMSSFIGSRSGNRGMCAQPCRKIYTKESGEKGYFLSPKDQLYSFEEIQKLKEIGVDSIKIEGRMKDPHYVFETVGYYRDLIEGVDREERTSSLFNRGYGKGYFYENEKGKIMNPNYPASLGKEVGKLSGRELKLSERVILGDGFSYLSSRFEKLGGSYLSRIEVKGEKEPKKSAEAGETILLKDLPGGTRYIFRSYAKEINDEIENALKKVEGRMPVSVIFKGQLEKNPELILWGYNNFGKKIEVSLEGESPLAAASKRAATAADVTEKLSELGETTFYLEKAEIHLEDGLFIPLSLIKSLKRDAAAKLEEELVNSYRRKVEKVEMYKQEFIADEPKRITISAIVSDDEQERILKELGIEKIYRKGYDAAREGNLEKIDLTSPLASNFYQLLENKNSKVILNWNLNTANRYAVYELGKISQLETVILSPEISFERMAGIGKTKLKKAVLVYSRPKGMYIELRLFQRDREIIENEQGDRFTAIKNSLGNTEIYLEKPMNIIKEIKRLESMGIDEAVLEFTIETPEEIIEVIKSLKDKSSEYRAYNYERGVY